MTFQAPEPLDAHHQCSNFSSGESALDKWLKQRALKSQRDGAARTYVVYSDQEVVGYFSLAVGSISHRQAIGKIRRNMPDPILVMVLARLAVDQRWQGRGLGYSMLQSAVLKTLQAAEIAGIRAMTLHTISPEARRFYQHFGFRESTFEPMTLIVTLRDLEVALLPQS
ncbi:MAG: GNAT family N-acetyltransferase [Candidatus Competibacteraceae bacterium]